MLEESPAPGERAASKPASFPVVGIGASAGGLESLEDFFANLPEKTGMAFVVIQHLSPDFRSMMSELLARHTELAISVAEHEMEVEPDHIYLIPPKKEMTIREGRLRLSDKEAASGLTLPIDIFFRSLAEERGKEAVAIVLSGSGSDGSRGIHAVKRAGGRVFVELPDSAKFDGMPLSALATGVANDSGTPAQLARAVVGAEAHEKERSIDGLGGEDDTPMESVYRLLRAQYGVDFGRYKRSTVGRRIMRRLAMHQEAGIEEYVERLRRDPQELAAMYHDLLIGVTSFFRDPEAFRLLEREVLPDLVRAVPEDEEVRVWVAGCATGEEAYSIAILLHERLVELDRPANYKVLATDVHRASLEKGSQGYYQSAQLENVSAARLERFFTRQPNGYQVSQDLRQKIVFAPHNVTRDAPFTRMHLITCRNLLIYLQPDTQSVVMSLFHFGLRKDGVLFLGASETPGPHSKEFDSISDHWRLYRKRRDVRLIDPMRLPVASDRTGTNLPALGVRPQPTPNDPQLLSIYDRLLDRFMPAALLVAEDRTLIDTFGGAEKYLRPKPRRPSNNVLDMLPGDLRTVVGGACQQASTSEGPVRYRGVPFAGRDGTSRVSVGAEAVRSRDGHIHLLITFEEECQPEPVEPGAVAEQRSELDAAGASQERVSALEAELGYTRETLQSAVEAHQTSNEELQATNEELVASNEELQSTNEELHSVNEELYTVNAEYQKKIIELRDLNNDMQHLLEGTDVAILFLDHTLSIRKFTPRMASIFHIRPEDVGRRLRDFSHELDRDQLFDDIERALRDDQVIEDEVRDSEAATYFLRIIPYRPPPPMREQGFEGSRPLERDREREREADEASPAQGGVMLSLTDISKLEHARARIHQLSAIVESSDDAISGVDLEGQIVTWNRGAEQLYGYTADEVVGESMATLFPEDQREEFDEILESVRGGSGMENAETIRRHKDGSLLDVSVTVSPIYDRHGHVSGLSSIARDITPLKQAQRDLEQREQHIRMLLESTAEAIYGLAEDGRCTFCNPACVRMLGYDSADELVGQRIHDLAHHSREDGTAYPAHDCPILSVLRNGSGAHSDQEVLFRRDGSSFPVEYWSYPIRRGDAVEGAVVTFLDITDRKRADAEVRVAAERREQFLAMLSHELRNPLAAVLSAVEVLEPGGDAQPSTRESGKGSAVEVIERQSRHMARLLDDLLDVSRITRGGISLRKEDLDLREPIEQSVEAVKPHLRETGLRLELELPSEPVPVRGDAARLQQVMVNLLTNAARYSDHGSWAKLSAEVRGDQVVVAVEDRGRGIEPHLLPQIFELFVQTDQGLDRSHGGLGVGLALVRQLVSLHGGEVSAHSEGPGKGSTFRVVLPLQEHANLAKHARPKLSPTAARVVLVEDQEDAREMMKMLLEKRGLKVFEAADGEAGAALIEEVHPDLALVDIGLPRLDGYSVARRLRENPVLNDVVLVALTGYGTQDDVESARAAGFDEHLTKPADPERIRDLLDVRAVRSRS